MQINIKVKNELSSKTEVEEAIRDSFKRELEVAKYKLNRYAKICKEFEDKYKTTSAKFFSEFEAGKLNEDDDFFDWYAAMRGVEIWEKKHQILMEISL